MSVYVDEAISRFRHMKMCHMIADSREELVAMADAIGVALKWIQHPGTPKEHFDVCLAKRKLAVAQGAVELGRREFALKLRARMSGERAR